jgi:hypothetical protein
MMNCRRIKELMPLFVEGDLDAKAMNEVSLHLSDCTACAQLVNEYSASQAWLQTYEMPDLDNAFFIDLKHSVMHEIEQNQTRPSWLQILAGRWTPNLAFAMAVALLILVGALVFSRYIGKTKIDELNPSISVTTPDEPKKEEKSPHLKSPDNKQEKNDQRVAYHPKHRSSKPKEKFQEPLPEQQTLEPLNIFASNVFENTMEANPINMIGASELPASTLSTRIDLQTSDPNIRIIWFAPKLEISQSTKIDIE